MSGASPQAILGLLKGINNRRADIVCAGRMQPASGVCGMNSTAFSKPADSFRGAIPGGEVSGCRSFALGSRRTHTCFATRLHAQRLAFGLGELWRQRRLAHALGLLL